MSTSTTAMRTASAPWTSSGAHRQVLVSAALLCALIAASGCATTGSDPPTFLGDHLDFKPAPDGSGVMIYVEPGLTVARVDEYQRFMIDPVAIWYSDDSEYRGIYPEELKAMADYFSQAAVRALQDRYPVVTKPGPDVMHIRAAFTGMKRRQPFHAYELVPVGLVFTAARDLSGANAITREKVLQHNSYIIEATIEVGFFDSVSNELLGAFWQTRDARPEHGEQNQGATWGQVKAALDAWAEELRHRLDNAHDAPSARRHGEAVLVVQQALGSSDS